MTTRTAAELLRDVLEDDVDREKLDEALADERRDTIRQIEDAVRLSAFAANNGYTRSAAYREVMQILDEAKP